MSIEMCLGCTRPKKDGDAPASMKKRGFCTSKCFNKYKQRKKACEDALSGKFMPVYVYLSSIIN